jgi:hypothetical protein
LAKFARLQNGQKIPEEVFEEPKKGKIWASQVKCHPWRRRRKRPIIIIHNRRRRRRGEWDEIDGWARTENFYGKK